MWDNWIVFKKNEITNPHLQLKKQGINFQVSSELPVDFSTRINVREPPCMQEMFEALLYGILFRNKFELYHSKYTFYQEMQHALHEVLKMLNYQKSEMIIKIFQEITRIDVSKETLPRIVVPCDFCGNYVYIIKKCDQCQNSFFCDSNCLKAASKSHDLKCLDSIRMTPGVLMPLQVEIHSGTDLKENVIIYYEHEKLFSLKMRGEQLFSHFFRGFLKNKWLKSNNYDTIEDRENSRIIFAKLEPEEGSFDEASLSDNEELDDEEDKKDGSNAHSSNPPDESIKSDEALNLPVIQEIKMFLLNQGGILQDILQETHQNFVHFIHIYYFP